MINYDKFGVDEVNDIIILRKANNHIPHDPKDQDWIAQQAVKAVEPDMVKKERLAINNAFDLLSELPTVTKNEHDQDLLDVPWEIQERPKVANEAWVKSTIEIMRIDELFATQKYINRETVAHYLENTAELHDHKNSLPNVLKNTNGDYLIYDGHHRLAAYWLMGAEFANVWLLKEKDL